MNEQLYVIGSSTPLAKALYEIYPNIFFFGRTNPYGFPRWKNIPGLETRSGITRASKIFEKVIKNDNQSQDHLVCLHGVSDTDWDKSINVNLLSTAIISELFCEVLTSKKIIGSITLMSSASVYIGGKSTYASSKGALNGLMNSMQSRYRSIRINIVLPGAFIGGMTADWDKEKVEIIGKQSNAGRLAETNEVASAIIFCIKNTYISQSIINMTGGRVIM